MEKSADFTETPQPGSKPIPQPDYKSLYESLAYKKKVGNYSLIFILFWVFVAEFLGTRHRNEVWQTNVTLWTDTLSKSPTNGRVMMNLGVELMKLGKYDLARYQFERAKLYVPTYAILEVNLGVLNAAQGNQKEAEFHFRQAIYLDPKPRDCYSFYAHWLRIWGRESEAENLLMLGGFK